MRKKYITFTSDKAALGLAFTAIDPSRAYHDVIDGEVEYKNFFKFKTISNGNTSISMLKILPDYADKFLAPLIASGHIECLAKVDGISCADVKPWENLSPEEWDKVYSAWPEGQQTDVYGNQPEFFGDLA